MDANSTISLFEKLSNFGNHFCENVLNFFHIFCASDAIIVGQGQKVSRIV
jgi:hypothetical protein